MSEMHFSEEVLSPQPTMGKELVDFWFAFSFWLGMFGTGVSVVTMWLMDSYSFELFGLLAGSVWFWSLTYGLLMVILIGFWMKCEPAEA